MAQYGTIAKIFLAVLFFVLIINIVLVLGGYIKPTMPWDEYMHKLAIIGHVDEDIIKPNTSFTVTIEPVPNLTKYEKKLGNFYICIDGVYQYYKPLYVEKKADYAIFDVSRIKQTSYSQEPETLQIAVKYQYGEQTCDKDYNTYKKYIKNFPQKYSSKGECNRIVIADPGKYYLPCGGKDGSPTFRLASSCNKLFEKEKFKKYDVINAKWLNVDFFGGTSVLLEYFDPDPNNLPKLKEQIVDNDECWPKTCTKRYYDVKDTDVKDTFDCKSACDGVDNICYKVCEKIPLKIRRGDTPILTSLSYKVQKNPKFWSKIQTELVDDGRCVPYDPSKQLTFNMKLTTEGIEKFAEAYKPVQGGPIYIYFRLYTDKNGEKKVLWPAGKDSAMLITAGLPFEKNMPSDKGVIAKMSLAIQETVENIAHALGKKNFDITSDEYITAKLPRAGYYTKGNDESGPKGMRYGGNYTDTSYQSPRCATGLGQFWYYSIAMRIPPAVMEQAENEDFRKENCKTNTDEWW